MVAVWIFQGETLMSNGFSKYVVDPTSVSYDNVRVMWITNPKIISPALYNWWKNLISRRNFTTSTGLIS